MRTRTTLDPAASGNQAVAVFERNGGMIVRGSFDPGTVDEPSLEIDEVLPAVPWGRDDCSEGARIGDSYEQFGTA